jgi:hypothetical protein
MRENHVLIILASLILHSSGNAQSTENKGWLFLTHTQKLSKKWDGLADIQFRSSNEWKRIETVLLRGALAYNINDEHAVALGYAYKGDWEEAISKFDFQLEHRIYQQYRYNRNLKRTELTARLRLEQRFVKEEAAFDFSQRFRGLLGFQIPLYANKDFSKGLYTNLQNELFVNIQHKEKVNNHFFDQSRSYISLGYRWSKKIDTEIGYMHWRQKEKDGTAISNVAQLMITTEL